MSNSRDVTSARRTDAHTASYPKAYEARNAQEDSRCAPPTQALELLLLLTKLAASGEIGRRVTGKRWKERIRGSIRVGGFHTYAGGGRGGEEGGKREGGFTAG